MWLGFSPSQQIGRDEVARGMALLETKEHAVEVTERQDHDIEKLADKIDIIIQAIPAARAIEASRARGRR
jgi:5,10-methylene-tetrahydrofolate dehydrogenase/methenyl tetrahydrofolate cyclohydrolase